MNPYEPPQSELTLGHAPILADLLEPNQRIEFSLELRREDLVRAFAEVKTRVDITTKRELGRLLLFLSAPFLLLGLLMSSWRLVGLLSLVTLVLCVIIVLGRWSIRRNLLALNLHRIGEIRGYIDKEYVCISHARQTRFVRIDCLVSSSQNDRYWVLCFDETQSQFDVIPFSAFANPLEAKVIADRLTQTKPICAPKVLDEQRVLLPSDPPMFPASESAIIYSGALLIADLEGTQLGTSLKKNFLRTLVAMSIFTLLIIGSILLVAGMNWFSMSFSMVCLFFLIYKPFRMIFESRQVLHDDQKVVMQSKGWFDSTGQFAMSTTGQTKAKWSLFESFEINENVLMMKVQGANLWHLAARRQFLSDADWDAACKLVREKIPSRDSEELLVAH